jgi:hypothetical protein
LINYVGGMSSRVYVRGVFSTHPFDMYIYEFRTLQAMKQEKKSSVRW